MSESLKQKSVKGMAWTGLERLVTQVLQFVVGIVIARVLMPEDYGVIGMLAIFIAIAQSFLDSGFANALIQKKDRTNVDYCTVFYFNIVSSLVLYLILFFAAPYIASFYKMPILTPVARVVSLSLIVNGLTIVQTAKLSIDLNFKVQSLATIVSTAISGFIGIYMAYSGFGVWALVAQSLSAAALRSIMLWACSKWRPSMIFSKASFNQLFSFGSKLLASGLINTIYQNMYTLVIGKFFLPADVGFFNRGKHFAQLPAETTKQVLLKVNFPVLSQFQNDDEKLVYAYQKLLRTPMFLLCPLMLGLAAIAGPLIEVLLGTKWMPCVSILQILCLGYLWVPLTHVNLNLLNVKGRSDLVLKLELIKKPIAFLILFASIPFGIWWMCLGRAFYSFFAFVVNCYYTNKIMDYGLIKQLKMLMPIFIYSTIMFALMYLTSSLDVNVYWKLIVGIVVGVLSYLLMAIALKDESLQDLCDILLKKFQKKRMSSFDRRV